MPDMGFRFRAHAGMPGYFPIPYMKISAPMGRKAPPSLTG